MGDKVICGGQEELGARIMADAERATVELAKQLWGKEFVVRLDKYTVRRGIVLGVEIADWVKDGKDVVRAVFAVKMSCGSSEYTVEHQVMWLSRGGKKIGLAVRCKRIAGGQQYDLCLDWKDVPDGLDEREAAEVAVNGTGSARWDWQEHTWETEIPN